MRIQLRMLDSKSRGARRGEGAGAGTGTGGGRPARRSTSIPCRINAAFLLFALFMSAGRCMASIFDAPPPFNVTTQSGYSAPMCTRLCYPWPTAVFSDHKTPCAQHEGDLEKWVPCICTHRPLIRYLLDCIFEKCGPAIESAIQFGYHVCEEYNVTFPPPQEAIVDLNVTLPNDAIQIPQTIPDMTEPFATKLPSPVSGGSASDEIPILLSDLVPAIAWRGKSIFLAFVWDQGSYPGLHLATTALWITTFLGLGLGFVGFF